MLPGTQQTLFPTDDEWADDGASIKQASRDSGYVTVKDIAQFMGVTVQRVEQLTREGVMKSEKVPGYSGRMYNFLPTVRTVLQYYRSKVKPNTEALDEAKLNQYHLKQRILEAKLEISEGNAHSTQVVERIWNDVIGSFKVKLYAIPELEADKIVGIGDRVTAAKALRGIATNLAGSLMAYDAAGFMQMHEDIFADDEDDGGDGDMEDGYNPAEEEG